MNRFLMLGFVLMLLFGCKTPQKQPVDVMELTIADIHRAYRNGDFTAEALVQAYLDRIEAYDQSTKVNAIVLVNPNALAEARALDQEFKQTGELRSLHGIPVIVKDNYNTKGLQTTAGSIALKGFVPDENAYQVQQLIEAGAIVLAKSNMAEWAFSPMHTVSSIGGETLNPYNLEHVPAGSSGGTAAAVAANFGTIGLGTDTGNSIRGPSSHNALVGIRSTLGLTSRHGIAPLYLRNDVGGPMCRTVADATHLLEVIAGYDSNDPVTKYSEGKMQQNYRQFLELDGLKGARIGVLRQLTEDIHPEIKALFDQAIADIQDMGAEIVDSFVIPDFDSLRANQWCAEFEKDINDYFATFVKRDTLNTLAAIVASGKYSDFVDGRIQYFLDHHGRSRRAEIPCGDPYTDPLRVAFREAIERTMDSLNVDVIIYPSWNYPPAEAAAYEEGYKGDNSQIIAPHTGQPAFTVPMGFTGGNLPAGLQFLGRMYAEPTLIRITYDYEQGTKHRRPPDLFPPLNNRK